MDLDIKRKERKALNSSLYSLTHRNARTIKLVSLRVRRIVLVFFCEEFRKDNIGVEGETLHGVAFVLQIGVCRIKCKVQSAKCKMSELRCDYNKTNLEHCRGR